MPQGEHEHDWEILEYQERHQHGKYFVVTFICQRCKKFKEEEFDPLEND